MARKISTNFIKELKTGSLKPLLEYVQNDDTLDLELRGSSIMIYYRGGKLLEIVENGNIFNLKELDKNYLTHAQSVTIPTITNISTYIPEAKHIVDFYIRNVRNHLWEKEIQQKIVRENNYSPNSENTDYFVIDIEYQDVGRADIVALRWDSKSIARKLQGGYLPQITIFEVKQGFNSVTGKSGMSDHLRDFNLFIENSVNITSFKNDMIEVFRQKRELGLIDGLALPNGHNHNDVNAVASDIDFVFLLANYPPASTQLKNELMTISDCKFIYANLMGYGLYARNIIDKPLISKFYE
jgi:hypothetical protein